MIKRSIYIGNPAYLKMRYAQLVVTEPQTGDEKGTIPIEDIALLMLDNSQITITHQLMVNLQENNVAIVSCNRQHLPLGLMLPLYGHTEHSEIVKHQIHASEPLKKQLWKQTIEQKIANQEAILKTWERPYEKLTSYKNEVLSGDATNREAMAAQYYWHQLFSDDFSRHREGIEPNNMLNFGYAILRSIVARALVSSGLLPVMGVFHRNKYNPYCLADDIMEPYRPYVDHRILEYVTYNTTPEELTPEIKAYLLKIATDDVIIEGKTRPLFVAISTTTASLASCYAGKNRYIKYPIIE